MAGLTIGKFAAAEGVGVETVRFHHRRGLLALPQRQGSGYREYSEADRWRLVHQAGQAAVVLPAKGAGSYSGQPTL
jgi:MerR family transcriptional regulator, mercuric resistance operon regulatory protein